MAFTSAQIPGIADRRYPPSLAGPHYPQGIPILHESELESLIARERVDEVVFAYSDIAHAEVMHRASRVLAAGAMGFLTKLSSPAQIEAAVRRVLSGRKHISPDLAESIIGHPQTGAGAPPHAALSARELEVLRLYATGVAPAGIAQRLKISAKTVSTYRTRILEKLELGTTADLIRYAVEHHLAG